MEATEEIDDERTANFFNRALGESQRFVKLFKNWGKKKLTKNTPLKTVFTGRSTFSLDTTLFLFIDVLRVMIFFFIVRQIHF